MRLIAADLALEEINSVLPSSEVDARLVESMGRYGQFQPIDVRAEKFGTYLLINGRHRLAAARHLGWTRIAALIEPAEDATLPADLKAILINTQRRSMTQLHMARHVRRLVREQEHNQIEIARALGRARSVISEMIGVLECAELEKAVDRDGLEWGAARVLVRLPFSARKAVLEELYAAQKRTGSFPPVREVREQVRLRQGKEPLPTRAAEELPEFLDDCLIRDVPIVYRAARGKHEQIEVVHTVAEPEEREMTRSGKS